MKTGKVVSCNLTGTEIQKRKREVLSLLKNKVLQRKELSNGYQYIFKGSDEIIDEIVSFIKSERSCCNFFTFKFSIKDPDTDIVLTITGPAGTKNFIIEEMDL